MIDIPDDEEKKDQDDLEIDRLVILLIQIPNPLTTEYLQDLFPSFCHPRSTQLDLARFRQLTLKFIKETSRAAQALLSVTRSLERARVAAKFTD